MNGTTATLDATTDSAPTGAVSLGPAAIPSGPGSDHRPSKLLLRCSIICAPLLAVLGFYVYCDPFEVLWRYQNYYTAGHQHVTLNRDYVSLESYKAKAPLYHYDSFILGNSRSIFYEWKDWSQHIGSDRIFHFDASSESLLGISRKLKYLDTRASLSNCLIILDSHTLATLTNNPGHLFTKHYELSGQNPLSFQWTFLKVFLDRSFLTAYLDFKLRGQFQPYMKEVLEERVWDYDPAHNELSLRSSVEKEIREGRYYAAKAQNFSPRDGREGVAASVIGPAQMHLLSEIREILIRHQCNYRIVISPLYTQVRFAREDLEALRGVFGERNVFDFSGVNTLTTPIENFYEDSHYRPIVARAIMETIYKEKGLSASR